MRLVTEVLAIGFDNLRIGDPHSADQRNDAVADELVVSSCRIVTAIELEHESAEEEGIPKVLIARFECGEIEFVATIDGRLQTLEFGQRWKWTPSWAEAGIAVENRNTASINAKTRLN